MEDHLAQLSNMDPPSGPPSLQSSCILKVVLTLERGYWHGQPWYENNHRLGNPFCGVTSPLIETMVDIVYCRFWKERPEPYENYSARLSLSDRLRPLLLSGRLVNFTVFLLPEPEIGSATILSLLAANCERLRCLRLLRHAFELNPVDFDDYVFEEEIHNLLSSAIWLQQITSDTHFDFTDLQLLKSLRTLELESTIPRFVDAVPCQDGFFMRTISSIKYIYLTRVEDTFWRNQAVDVAFLLLNLPHLKYIQTDITQALELIHGLAIENGRKITSRYKLTKAQFSPFSRAQIQIFSATCPNVTNLHLILQSSKMLRECEKHLSLPKLSKLLLQRLSFTEVIDPNSDRRADETVRILQISITKLLKKLGCERLKSLRILFCAMDAKYEYLYSLCPSLTKLELQISSEMEPSQPLQAIFSNLTRLCLFFVGGSRYYDDNLLMLLTAPLSLEKLRIFNADHLTDHLMDAILKRNKLCNVKVLEIDRCKLSEQSLRRLLEQCRNLESVVFTSSLRNISRSTLRSIGREINPRVYVSDCQKFTFSFDSFQPRQRHVTTRF